MIGTVSKLSWLLSLHKPIDPFGVEIVIAVKLDFFKSVFGLWISNEVWMLFQKEL